MVEPFHAVFEIEPKNKILERILHNPNEKKRCKKNYLKKSYLAKNISF